MIISNYHVQHILKSYSQQLSSKTRASRDKIQKGAGQRDEVTFSSESKKMLLVDKIVNEIVAQLENGSNRNETSRSVLNQLSQEYGRPLDVDHQEGSGITFKVLNETGQGVVEYLSARENEQLKKRLIDITQSFVYRQLI